MVMSSKEGGYILNGNLTWAIWCWTKMLQQRRGHLARGQYNYMTEGS